MAIINLTPHTVTIYNSDGNTVTVEPSGVVARVEVERVWVGRVDGVDVFESRFGEVVDLPPLKEGMVYVVSGLVLAALNDRSDVYSPGELVRDSSGRVIGCRGLTRRGVK